MARFRSLRRCACCTGRFSPSPASHSSIACLTCAVASRNAARRRCASNQCSEQRRRRTMEVILLERIAKLGQMGDVVRVKDGFARNFLLPKGKALRATKDNRGKFETMKSQLEARNLEQQS